MILTTALDKSALDKVYADGSLTPASRSKALTQILDKVPNKSVPFTEVTDLIFSALENYQLQVVYDLLDKVSKDDRSPDDKMHFLWVVENIVNKISPGDAEPIFCMLRSRFDLTEAQLSST